MFKPYAVQCTTCNSRLRVTNPAIIGTIATCPSCHSMVEISPPITDQESDAAETPQAPQGQRGAKSLGAQQVAVGSSSIDSEAITEEAINADPGEVVDPSTAPQGFTTDETVSAPADETDPLSGPMPPQWQSERTQRSRQVAMVVALAASGLLAAVLLFGWFVKNWNEEKVAQQNTTSQAIDDVEPDDKDVIAEPAPEPTQEPKPTEEVDPLASPAEVSPPPALEDPKSEEATPVDTKIAAPGLMPKTTKQSPTEIPNGLVPEGFIPGSPLDDLDTQSKPAKSAHADEEPDDPAPDEIPEGLKDLIQIVELDGDKTTLELDAPATPQDVEIAGAAEENVDPMLIDSPPEPINFRSALAIKLGLLPKSGKYPFSDLMLFLSQVSGVPIQIDWVMFDLVGIDIRDGVAVERNWNSVGEIIEKVAGSIGATVKQDEFMMTISPSEERVQGRLKQLMDMSDFGDNQASAISTLNSFLVGRNNPGVNAKTPQVGKQRDDQRIAVFAVEALRRMHKLPPKIDDRIFLRWAQNASSESLGWPIVTDGDPGQQINSPVAVAGLLRRISRNNNATCFVNWFDANRRKLSPEQLVMPHMNASAGKVMADMLQPFEMQVRRVDDSHWWLGTEATYDQFPVIVWTPPLGSDKAIFVQRIVNAASKNNAKFKITIDPDSGSALMLLPRFIVRQMPKIQNGLNLTVLN